MFRKMFAFKIITKSYLVPAVSGTVTSLCVY